MIPRTREFLLVLLFSLMTLTGFSQEFNDSIMNHVLFDEVIAYHEKRNNKVDMIYFSKVAAELHSKGSVEYMETNGCRHRPSHSYINSLPKNEVIIILNDVGLDTTEYTYVGRCEILARIPIRGETTYQKVAQIALDCWLKSKGHQGTIMNLGKRGHPNVLGISSSYNEKTRSVDIALTNFGVLK